MLLRDSVQRTSTLFIRCPFSSSYEFVYGHNYLYNEPLEADTCDSNCLFVFQSGYSKKQQQKKKKQQIWAFRKQENQMQMLYVKKWHLNLGSLTHVMALYYQFGLG